MSVKPQNKSFSRAFNHKPIYGFEQNQRRLKIMNNKKLVPEAKEAMDKFKMEAANEVDVSDTY